MLIITRKLGERITIGDDIVVSLLDIKGGQVRIGIDAPKHVSIHREEIYDKIRSENRVSASVDAADLRRAATILNRHCEQTSRSCHSDQGDQFENTND